MGPLCSPRGLVVGGFRLEERLGRGGGGQVFRAREEASGRVVALKVLRDVRALAQLERALAVRHPGLVRMLEAGEAPAGAYVVMEALEGITLRQSLETRGRLDVATALGGVSPAPAGDAVFGSAGYLSPEQASGEALDPRSDVFGVGLLLFELVTGELPFPATQAVAAAYAVVHRPAPQVGDARLQPVLDVALAKAPADRFPDAAAFALALRALAPDAALSAAAPWAPARP